MPLSFELSRGAVCPCHKKPIGRVVQVVDPRNRRFSCARPGVTMAGETSWHWFDEYEWIKGRPPEFNEHGEVAP